MIIDFPKFKLVSPNQSNSEHWTTRHKRNKLHDRILRFYLKGLKFPLPCIITLTRIAPRHFDSDNLQGAFKSVRDSLCQIILGGQKGQLDSDPRICWLYTQKKGAPKEYAIEIHIQPQKKNND